MRKRHSTYFHLFSCRSAQRHERGVALIITLLILVMIIALSLGMVIAFSSETLIGGYYRNFRGSFYAADSGLNIARERFVTGLTNGVPGTFAVPPISTPGSTCGSPSSGLEYTVLNNVINSYGSSTALNAGAGAASWKESFRISSESLCQAQGSPVITSTNNSASACSPQPAPCPTGYRYTYNYVLTSVGAAQGGEQATVTENGSIIMNVTGQAATSNVSFAYFGGFVDKYPPCLGPLVPGTMTGPMFTNDGWEFMASIPPWTAPYIFTDPVGQGSPSMNWWDSGWGCHTATTTGPWGSGNNLVNPNFQAGYQLNQPPVTLPTNSFSQEWAVIDGAGCGEGGNMCGNSNSPAPPTPTKAQLNTDLQNVHGTAYPSAGASSGVYLANPGTTAAVCGAKTPPCVQGGGFYIEGNANVVLKPSGSTAQVYTITQGSTVTTITVDPAGNNGAGSTVITSGSPVTTLTLSGVPTNSLTGQASTMLYDDGSITSLSGPGEGQGAVQDNTMITITALNNVTATGDVLYKTEPVTYTQNQIVPGSNPPCCAGTPMDTLIPTVENMNQVLGIFTATGNFIIQSSYADHNIQVDGSIATVSQQASSNCNGGDGGFLANGFVNTFNNVGGQIQSCIYAADIDVENVWFDRRFTARPNFAPPWFPSTTITQGGPLPTNVVTTVQRTQWLNTSAM
ncbi:MAG: hypothetical protein ACLP1Y_06930 [Candidatus Acidiferrales bacterium]